MPAKQSKCCCGGNSSSYWLYAAYFSDDRIYRIDPDDGSFTIWADGATGNVRAIACHPDGRVFVASGAANDSTVYCLDVDGTLIWSTTKTSVGAAGGVGVTNDGWVYLCTRYTGGISGVYKFAASDGTENTDDSWPYVVGAVNQRFYYCLCVDQVGNVYVGGDHASHTIRALALDSSGAVIWTSAVSSGGADVTSNGCHGIAINASGGQVHCLRATDPLGEPAVNEIYTLNATTGVITGGFSADSGGSIQSGNSAAYDVDGNYYSGVALNAGHSNKQIFKNGSAFYLMGTFQCLTMAAGPDGNVFAGGIDSAAPWDGNAFSIIKGWKMARTDGFEFSCMDVSTGRLGAFGL